MRVCTMPECQTTAGCKCAPIPPLPVMTPRKALWEYTDEEIAREYHARALRKLGDPRVCVGIAFEPPGYTQFTGYRP